MLSVCSVQSEKRNHFGYLSREGFNVDIITVLLIRLEGGGGGGGGVAVPLLEPKIPPLTPVAVETSKLLGNRFLPYFGFGDIKKKSRSIKVNCI